MTDLVPVTRTVVDYEDRLADFLRSAASAGRLVTDPESIRPARTESGRYIIRVTVLEPAPRATVRGRLAAFDRRHPILGPCAKALAFGACVAVFLAAMVYAVLEIGYHAIGAATIGRAVAVILGASAVIAVLGTLAGGNDHKGKGWHYTKCK